MSEYTIQDENGANIGSVTDKELADEIRDLGWTVSTDAPSDEARAAVSKALAFFDVRLPTEWRSMIDTSNFDIENRRKCPLGQMYGDWGDGMRALDLSYQDGDEMGLDISPSLDGEDLNAAWREALA